MKEAQKKPAQELRMSSKEFDRIMGRALQVKPEGGQKTKRSTKTAARKKRRTNE